MISPEPSDFGKCVSASIFFGGIVFLVKGVVAFRQADEETSRWKRIDAIAKIAIGFGAIVFSSAAPDEFFELRAPMTLARLP